MSEIGSISLDDHLIARTVQGSGPTALLQRSEKELGLSPKSSIEAISPQFSPVLMPPKQNIMIRVLKAHEETERLAERRTKNFELDSAKALAEIEKLSLEREEAFRKEMEATKNRDSWSTLSIVAQYLASASTITLGLTVGGVPGILLVFGGAAGGLARVLNDTHLMTPLIEWYTKSKELQASIQQQIDTGTMYLQMGLGLAGGMAAWYATGFAAMQAANTLDYLTKASSMITSASTVMTAGAQVGATYQNKRIADLNALTRELELGIHEQRQDLTHQTKDIGEILDTNESQSEQIRKAIQRQEIES